MPRSELSTDAASVYSFTTEDTATSEELARRRPKKYKFHKKFAYQKFKGWRPILTARGAELFFSACGVLLLALGIPILIASLNVVEYKVPYGFEGPFADIDSTQRQELLWGAPEAGVQYDVSIYIDKRMEPPIWVSYELGSFFQNFRRYVRSYDPNRMNDGADSGSPLSACEPFAYLQSDSNTSLPINPCGQIAHSFFNDSFSLSAAPADPSAQPQALPLDASDIAWPSDRKHLYGPVPAENYNPGGGFAWGRGGNTSTEPLNENQHWMVWMKPHSRVAVQKLYGRLDEAIPEGTTLTITINNRYNTYDFGGPKSIIISTNSWVGGRNNFLGACYIAVGGLCLLAALFFFVGYDLGVIGKRTYGDLSQLSWLKQHEDAIKHQQQEMKAKSSSRNLGGSSFARGVQVQAYQGDADALPSSGAAAPQADGLPKN